MGYSAYSQFIIGTNLFNIVQEIYDTKTIDVKDEWSDKIIGTKQITRKHYIFNGEEFNDLYDIEMKLKELGLAVFYTDPDSKNEFFVGIGDSTHFKKSVISTNINEINDNIDLVKKILEKLGYMGEIGIYSILSESY